MKTRISVRTLGLILMLVLSLSNKAICQLDPSDSLMSLLKLKSGPERIDLLFKIARTYGDVDNWKALSYAEEGLGLATDIGDSVRIVKLGRVKAQLFRRLNKIDSAVNLFNKLIRVATRLHLDSELASILNSLGLIYHSTGQYDKALKHLIDALSLREKEGDVFYICGVLNNIGLVYHGLSDFDKALLFYNRSVEMKKRAIDQSGLDLFYSNIALCYAEMRDLVQANTYIDKTISICGNSCSKKLLAYVFHCRGIIAFYENDFLKAEGAFLKAYGLSVETDDRRYMLNTINYLLRVYIGKNQFTEAEKYLNRVDAIVSSGAPFNAELSNIYYNGIKLFRKTKRFEKMSLYQDKYMAIMDTIFNEGLTTGLMKIEAEYLEKENLTKIESQSKILALNIEVIRTHRFLNIFIGIVALLLMILIVVLVKSNRLKQKHNMLLDKKVQERTHQLQLNHDSLQRASLERDILLQKISTDINNALVTLKGLCSLGMKDIQDPHALEYISKMNTTSESFSNILTKLHFIRSGNGILK